MDYLNRERTDNQSEDPLLPALALSLRSLYALGVEG